MRLMVNPDMMRAYVGDIQRQGWVEICVNQVYRRVCDLGWNNKEASIICGELGLSRFGEYITDNVRGCCLEMVLLNLPTSFSLFDPRLFIIIQV